MIAPLCVSGLHRRLGLAGASLAIGLVVSGYMATVQMVRRGFDLSGDLTALPVLTAFVVHDRRVGGRVHPVTIWGGGGLIVLANLQALLIGPSHAWGRLVAWRSA